LSTTEKNLTSRKTDFRIDITYCYLPERNIIHAYNETLITNYCYMFAAWHFSWHFCRICNRICFYFNFARWNGDGGF